MEKTPVKQFETKPWPEPTDSDDSDMENDVDVEKLGPLEIGPNENRLQHTYCLWFSRKGTHRATDYSKSLHFVGRCGSVQQWWSLYSHLIRPTALKPFRELSLFKQGIKPMWEDPANTKGGQWVIRLRKNKIDRAWENVCMAMLGEQFLVGDEICGIVLTTKYPFTKKLAGRALISGRSSEYESQRTIGTQKRRKQRRQRNSNAGVVRTRIHSLRNRRFADTDSLAHSARVGTTPTNWGSRRLGARC